MPEGFGFPLNHRMWIPLRADRTEFVFAPPAGAIFGRLASGFTIESAEAELSAVGLLPVSDGNETSSEVRLRVLPYALNFVDDVDPDQLLGRSGNARFVIVLLALLLLPPSVNIAMLVYARTIARQEEVAVRTALGAGRKRIVVQLFLEMLVPSGLAAGAVFGFIALASEYLNIMMVEQLGQLPFWIDFGVSLRVSLFVSALAVLVALVAGLVPAVQVTGRMTGGGLRHLSSRTRIPLGFAWTSLAVLQVAFSFAVFPAAMEVAWGVLRPHVLGYGFAADEFVTARTRSGLWAACSRHRPSATTSEGSGS